MKDVSTEEDNEDESSDGSSDEELGDELAGDVEEVLVAVELECVDDLEGEEKRG